MQRNKESNKVTLLHGKKKKAVQQSFFVAFFVAQRKMSRYAEKTAKCNKATEND